MVNTILIIEDDARVLDILSFVLRREGYHVITAPDGLTGLRIAEERQPAMILIDTTKTAPETVEVCLGLEEMGAQVHILPLLTSDEQWEEVSKFDINADYIKKPFPMQELLMRVRMDLFDFEVDDEMMKADCLRVGGIVINKGRDMVTKNGVPIDLSKREMDLLLYLASKPGIVITREELLKQVWEYSYLGDMRNVDVTIRRLREKLEDDPSQPTLIVTRRGRGYVFAGQ